MNIKKSILLRVRLAFLFVALFAVAIMARIVNIQMVEGAKWVQMAEDIGLQFREVKATRGNIYSDNGSLMATSVPYFKLALDPSIASEETYKRSIDSLAFLLSDHFKDRPTSEYKRRINNARMQKKQYVLLNAGLINYQDKKKMQNWPLFREGRLRGGVVFEKVDKRIHPFSRLGFRTIGFINENGHSRGLEFSFNDELSGTDGKALYQKMAGGNWKPVYDASEVRPSHGNDIETTIDINLQDVSESALLKALVENDAEYGSVIVMEVATGEIKAISNLSRSRKGVYGETYNYAVASQGATEPGSTFKLASMIALLEDGGIEPTDSIDAGNGKHKFYNANMTDHKPGGYGMITVQEAFEKSSNIAISKLVDERFGLKPQRFVDYLHSMGIGQPLGFQMVGEGMPVIKRPDDPTWSGTTLPWMSIGYEVKLTPLQTLAYYNAVANNGKLIQPIIVRRTLNAGKTQEQFTAKVLNPKICSEETLLKVQSMLEGVVDHGTASNIKDSYYKIAGKTGTAQSLNAEGRGYSREYYTSFAGYFPADKPKYSCIVIINKPKGFRQYGGDMAAPVFKQIADKIYARDLEMHSPLPTEFQVDNGVFPLIQTGFYEDLRMLCNTFGISNHNAPEMEEWVSADRKSNAIEWQPRKSQSDAIPDVKGMTLRDAIYLLENKGLKVEYTGKGRVSSQSQPAGSKVSRGSHISIKLS